MKQHDTKEKTCENCRYYLKHYVKSRTGFYPTVNGHCIHDKNKSMIPVPCRFWEDIVIQKEERLSTIKAAVISMATDLKQISLVLKDDKDN